MTLEQINKNIIELEEANKTLKIDIDNIKKVQEIKANIKANKEEIKQLKQQILELIK